MSDEEIRLLPYSYIVGQRELCDLLEISHVMRSRVGGVLVSGERGTAKSTIVRSFARMLHGLLPVTLPINATDDRVIGGWNINALMQGKPVWQEGLLQKANGTGLLYIDEVNLLDDHIINIILDVVSTGVLVIERDGKELPAIPVDFSLVGTMNPEEGMLRPQLLDRFGLYVPMAAEESTAIRREILSRVIKFDQERNSRHSEWLAEGMAMDAECRDRIKGARETMPAVVLTEDAKDLCARVAAEFKLEGHRGEIIMAKGAQAWAALNGRLRTIPPDVWKVAKHTVMHRRRDTDYSDGIVWSEADEEQLASLFAEATRH
jgi:magnesium chelatase subunit I